VYRRIAAIGATVAVIVGVAVAALAVSGRGVTAGNPSSGPAGGVGQRHFGQLGRGLLRHAVHGEITTSGKNGFVTHSGVIGAVTSVSATSITVRAADGFTETFSITGDTIVRKRTAGLPFGQPATISDVSKGDRVGVVGKAPEHSTSAPTATVVIDGLWR
jgi:hypothetical protein